MADIDVQMKDLFTNILENGYSIEDRTGTGTLMIPGHRMYFDLSKEFPLMTTKKTPFKLILSELLWFLDGNKDIDYLHKHNNHIWDEWVKEDGTFGPIYGQQWTQWPTFRRIFGSLFVKGKPLNQIENVLKSLKEDPYGRRHIVTAWNPPVVESGEMALPPCHMTFQFTAVPLTNDKNGYTNGLVCHLYQRSADTFLGVPFNIASYSLLTHMFAKILGPTWKAIGFDWHGMNVHLYNNHINQVGELLKRNPDAHSAPKLIIPHYATELIDFDIDNVYVEDYSYYPFIKAEVSV